MNAKGIPGVLRFALVGVASLFLQSESGRAVWLLRWCACRRPVVWFLKVQAPFWSGLFFYARRTMSLAGITHAFHQ